MKKRITHVPNHSFIIILTYQNQFIRILIYQNQSEKKKEKKKKKREYPCEFGELTKPGTNLPIFKIRQISTKLEVPKA